MSFAETLACGLTVALLMAFPVFWWKEPFLFRLTARMLIFAITAAFVGAMIYSVGYEAGTFAQEDRDIAQFKAIRAGVDKAVQDATGDRLMPTPDVVKVANATPLFIKGAPFVAPWDIVPAWFWVCGMLLLIELVILSGTHYSRGGVAPNDKTNDGAGNG